MQITLFRALQSVKISDDQATAVLDRLQLHVESVVESNITRIEGRITGVEATLEGLKMQINFVGAMLGIVGLAIAAGPVIAKLIH